MEEQTPTYDGGADAEPPPTPSSTNDEAVGSTTTTRTRPAVDDDEEEDHPQAAAAPIDDDDDNVAPRHPRHYAENYYPTFPAEDGPLRRYDSDVFGADDSDDDSDDDDDEEDDDDGEYDGGYDNCRTGSFDDAMDRAEDDAEEDEDKEDAVSTIVVVAAAEESSSSFVAPHVPTSPLPRTHRPFRNDDDHNHDRTRQSSSPSASPPPRPTIPLSSLPMDALHAASTYCTPSDWAALSSCDRAWRGAGQEVFGKVRRHAGRCMVEVGVAWVSMVVRFFILCFLVHTRFIRFCAGGMAGVESYHDGIIAYARYVLWWPNLHEMGSGGMFHKHGLVYGGLGLGGGKWLPFAFWTLTSVLKWGEAQRGSISI